MAYKYYEIPVCYLASGLELKLPVHEFSGGKGPVLGMTAAIHGDEAITVEIARLVVEHLKTEKNINGTIKIMSVANPLAYEMVSRNTPIDGANMNRVFPGNKHRTTSEVQAHVIATEFLETLDLYIDIHAGGQDPVVDYTYVTNDEGFSRSFGSRILYRPEENYSGTSATVTLNKNIPSVTLECGGGPNIQYYVDKGLKGILNMLRYKGLIDGTPEPPGEQIMITHIEHVNPHHSGMFVPAQSYDSLTGIIKGKGVVLGRIYNPMTLELLEEIKTPYEENLMILMRCDYNRILAGDFSFMIGDLSSEVK